MTGPASPVTELMSMAPAQVVPASTRRLGVCHQSQAARSVVSSESPVDVWRSSGSGEGTPSPTSLEHSVADPLGSVCWLLAPDWSTGGRRLVGMDRARTAQRQRHDQEQDDAHLARGSSCDVGTRHTDGTSLSCGIARLADVIRRMQTRQEANGGWTVSWMEPRAVDRVETSKKRCQKVHRRPSSRRRERALKVRSRRQTPSSASMLSALSHSSDRCCTPWEELESAVRKMVAEENSVLAEESEHEVLDGEETGGAYLWRACRTSARVSWTNLANATRQYEKASCEQRGRTSYPSRHPTGQKRSLGAESSTQTDHPDQRRTACDEPRQPQSDTQPDRHTRTPPAHPAPASAAPLPPRSVLAIGTQRRAGCNSVEQKGQQARG
jgi:hypothetical protein